MIKISVCLASYNGAKFIGLQLNSILHQLREQDEVIVVDDDSVDNTRDIVAGICDPRIKLIKNAQNLGLLKTFETALHNASGDIIALSDQDDIWFPNKIDRILDVFAHDLDVSLIASTVQVINDKGEVTQMLHPRFIQENKRYWLKNVISNILVNRYLGCTLVFRRHMLAYILPVPNDIPMHDMWIGIINDIWGKTYYVQEPLIQYRRHSNNVTSGKHSTLPQIIKWRYNLIKNLVVRIIKVVTTTTL